MNDRQRHPLWSLLFLTLLAGVLRFAYIDRPAIWGDEAATWRRINGSYQQMLDELRSAGFMPGHYVLTWWIKEGFPVAGEWKQGDAPDLTRRGPFDRPRNANRAPTSRTFENFTPTVRLIEDGIKPTPLVMRFIPALCGTLMVPAIYFLASRLVARRTALLAALFVCCSAYMLNYSRDAKMYMQFWFFATLHLGCLLWWLDAYCSRTQRPTPPMVNDDVVTGVRSILPEQHITRIGQAFVGNAPAPIDWHFPSRLETTVRWLCWVVSGLAMIAFHAIGLGVLGLEVLVFLVTLPLRSWLFRQGARIVAAPAFALAKRLRRTPVYAADDASASPLRRTPAPGSKPDARDRFRLFIPPIIGFVLGIAAVVSLWMSYKEFTRFYERVNPNDEIARMDLGDAGISWVEPYNRGRSAAGHFLFTASAYLMNWEWVKPDQMDDVDPRALRLLRYSAASLLIAISLGLIPWRQLIRRKPTDLTKTRGRNPLTGFVILAAWLILPVYGFYVASGAWNEDGRKVRAPAPLQGLLAQVFPGAHNDETRSLAGTLGAELSSATRAKGLTSHDWGQLFIVHGIDLSQTRWWLVAVVVGAAMLLLLNRWWTWKEKALLVGRAALIVIALWVLATLAFVFTPPQSGSVWMPRYVGFVFPAFAIIVAVLIRRLPFAPVRWLVVAGLIGTNLSVFYFRCAAGEPRTDLMARDYKIARDSDEVRMFARELPGMMRGAPGNGSTISMPAVYYVTLATDLPMSPRAAMQMQIRDLDLDPLPGDYIGGLLQRLKRDTKADEFFFWLERTPDQSAADTEAALRASLDASWQPVRSPQAWTVYDHWTWRKLYLYERHHWKRVPATKPTISPATAPTTPATSSAVDPGERPGSNDVVQFPSPPSTAARG